MNYKTALFCEFDKYAAESYCVRQVGYINNYNGDANRVYDGGTVARVLKAEAGGGRAKTGWYTVGTNTVTERDDNIEHRTKKPPGEAPQEKPQDYDS